MDVTFDLNAAIGAIDHTHAEWLEQIISTIDRDALLDHAKNISISPTLRDSDREHLHKLIAKRLGSTIKVLRQDLAREIDGSEGKVDKDDRQLARETLDENLIFSGDGFYRWRDTGVWSPSPDREVRTLIGNTLEKNGLPVKNRMIGDVLNLAKDEAFDRDAVFDMPQGDRVNVLNGTLELKVGEWVLREHRREDFLTSQLPVEWHPDATCPRFRQFLDEVFAGDEDAADKCLLILEMTGYTLLQTCALEKFIMLIGGGSNGKSVLLKVLQALVGKYGYSAVTPSDLSNETSRLMLRGKLANIVPELPAGSVLADDAMKAFTSGEATSAKKLYADKITFTPFATLWMGTNNLSHSRDLSRGMFRRALLVEFNQSFEGREDVHLIDKLVGELPGILVAALQAYAKVEARGNFTIPASSVAACKAWRLRCDQVATWLEERTEPDLDGVCRHSSAFADYQMWALTCGIKLKVSKAEFTLRLESLGKEAGRSYFDDGDTGKKKQDRSLRGFTLRSW